jgi:hypothetical protein
MVRRALALLVLSLLGPRVATVRLNRTLCVLRSSTVGGDGGRRR